MTRALARCACARWLCLLRVRSRAAAPPEVSYTVSLTSPEQHLVEVQIMLPAGSAQRELQLPVWNALYQVRDFSQYVNWVRAKDRSGKPLAVREVNPSRWRIARRTRRSHRRISDLRRFSRPVRRATESAPRLLQSGATPDVSGRRAKSRPIAVHFSRVPDGWHIATPLASSRRMNFTAENYDRLVDSPVEIGLFRNPTSTKAEAHYRVIIDAESADYDPAKIVAALHKIVACRHSVG